MKKIVIAVIAACAVAVGAVALAQQAQRSQPSEAQAAQRTAAVAAAVAEHERRFNNAPRPTNADQNTAYQFEFTGLWTERVPMTAFRGEVVLVVNTASRCGLTPQYEGLQRIYSDYHAQGFEVLGVPSDNFAGQEYGTAQEIQNFCTLNYGVTFPMAGAANVITDANRTAHPFYRWALTQVGDEARPRWNFHKILLGRDGRIIATFGSRVDPGAPEVRAAIAAALARPS